MPPAGVPAKERRAAVSLAKINWLERLPNDEIEQLLNWMCSTGTTTTLTMLARLRATSKHYHKLVEGQVEFSLRCDPRRTVLTTMEHTLGELTLGELLSDILKCHRVFASAEMSRLPAWTSLEEVDDDEWDAAFDSNREGVRDVANSLCESLDRGDPNERAPKAVEDAALAHVASSLTTDDEQLYMILYALPGLNTGELHAETPGFDSRREQGRVLRQCRFRERVAERDGDGGCRPHRTDPRSLVQFGLHPKLCRSHDTASEPSREERRGGG